MRKITIFFLSFILLFAVGCSRFKKILTLEPKVSAQEKRIQELEKELEYLKSYYDFQLEFLAQDLERFEEFIFLLKTQQDEFLGKSVYPFIPEEVEFCGEKVPLNRFGVKERLERALMYEMNRWAMALVFLRSGRWFPIIEEKIKEKNLPEDLKYIAVIESDLNLEAYSRAGAAGFWQFIEKTGKLYLVINSYIDERYDPERSTEAALKYFEDLHQEPGLNDWMSVLASYNMGKDRYLKEKIKERAQDFYDVQDIPLETRRYPFRAIAVKLIMENPEKYGFLSPEKINEVKYEPYPMEVQVITVTQQKERIVDIAQQLGMTYQEFRVLNPHILILKSERRRNYGEVIRDHLPRGHYRIYVLKKRTQ